MHSDNIWELKELPKRMLFLGGGPIGCELAQCFSRLGSKVTIIDIAPTILPREDPEIAFPDSFRRRRCCAYSQPIDLKIAMQKVLYLNSFSLT